MRPEDSIRVGRITRVLNEFVRPRRRGPTASLDVAAYHVHGEPVPAVEAFGADYEPFPLGGSWGPPWDTTWFRLRGTIPVEWTGCEVALGFGIGGAGSTGFGAEALVWRDGRPVQGLSPNHKEYVLTTSATAGEDVELFVEAAANPPSPFGANPWPMLLPDPDGAPLFTLDRADLHVRDPEFEAFWHDFRVLVELLTELPDGDPRSARLCRRARAGLQHARAPRHLRQLASGTAGARGAPGAPACAGDAHREHRGPRPSGHRVALAPARDRPQVCPHVQHGARAHGPVSRIPVRGLPGATPGVDARPLSRSLGADEGPRSPKDVSSPPEACGSKPTATSPPASRWSARSSTANASIGQELGIETRDVWLPDVFGYSAALPQIMSRSGIRWFLTQKLSWNQYNVLPHHSFLWEGIDGSRVFTHFPPADTYNGNMGVRELRFGVENFKDHDRATRSLYLFGWGDGGGGPTSEMLESARRLADIDGMPRLDDAGPPGVLHRGRVRDPRPGGLGRRALPGAAPRYLHQPSRHQARQPPRRVRPAGGRALELAGSGVRLPRRQSSRSSGRPCSSTNSTTSSPGRGSTGSTTTPHAITIAS